MLVRTRSNSVRTAAHHLRGMRSSQLEQRVGSLMQTLLHRPFFDERAKLPPLLRIAPQQERLIPLNIGLENKALAQKNDAFSVSIEISAESSLHHVIPQRVHGNSKSFLIYDLIHKKLHENEWKELERKIGDILQKNLMHDALLLQAVGQNHNIHEVKMVVLKSNREKVSFCSKGAPAVIEYLFKTYGNRCYLQWNLLLSDVDFYE